MKHFDLSLLCILLLALGGGLLVLFASPWGIGLSPDSVQYIQAARNLHLGSGLSIWGEQGYQPLTHFPPLYPLLLAVDASSQEAILAGAYGLQAILFAANIASVGVIVWICSPHKRWSGALAAGVAFCALPILEIHTWAWSEPLFLLLSTWGLFLLYRHLDKPSTALLVSAAGLVALACLARYTGLAVALAGVSSILLLSRKGPRYRIMDGLVFILVSLLPLVIWLASNALHGTLSTDRLLVYHPLSLAQAKTAVVVFTTWLAPMPLPNEVRLWLAIFLCCLLLAGAFFLWKRRKAQHLVHPIAFLAIFILSYLLALAVSLSLFDSSTPVNNRLLSPVFVACLILAACLAGGTLSPYSTGQKIALALCFLWITSTHLQQATGLIGQWRQQGLGYASAAWAQSGVLRELGSLAPGMLIYSNEPEAIYLYSGQHALPLPEVYNPITRLPNNAFNAEMEQMGQKIRDHNAILVLFRTSSWRPYQPMEAEILERLPLTPSMSGEDGIIYTWKATR